MAAILAESKKLDSELVIGSNLKSPRSEAKNEQTLVQLVKDRAALHQQKPERCEFTPSDHWIDKRGDRALTQLLNLHDRRICNLVVKQQQDGVGSADVDLKQEAIAAFIEAIYRYDPSKGAALFSYAYFRIMDRLQCLSGRDNRNTIATGRSFGESAGFDYSEIRDIYQHEELTAAVSLLPERQQEIIWLRQQEVPFKAIAEQLKLSLKYVQSLYYRGLKKLRSFLSGALSCVLPIQSQVPVEPVEPVEITELQPVVAEPVIEVREIEPVAPKPKAQGHFKQIWRLFKKEPITNSKPNTRAEFSPLTPLKERPMLYTAKSAQLQNTLPNWFSLLPPFWILGAVATILVNTSGEPILSNFLLGGWVATLITAFGIKRYRNHPLRWSRERFKFLLAVVSVAILSATFICPDLVMAQTAPGGGAGGGCSNLGFLSPVGTFTVNLFSGVGSGTGGSGSGASVSETACKFIGFILWAIVIGTVGSIGYFGVQIATNNGQIAVIGFPLVGILFIVLGCLAAFAIFGLV